MTLRPTDFIRTDHPFYYPDRCINRKQRRVVCTRCSELCPTGVFSLKGGAKLDWSRCVDCGICTANCPTRCFTFSATARKRFSEEIDFGKTTVFACRREEARADVRVRCLGALPWELLAVCALRGKIALRTDACASCPETDWQACLEENLEALRAFLGEAEADRVLILHGEEETEPEALEQENPGEKRLTRRGLFSGMKRTAAKNAMQAVAERLPFFEESEEDFGMQYRRMLAAEVQRLEKEQTAAVSQPDRRGSGTEQSNGKNPERRFTVTLPRFNIHCTACGICEKICPQKAIRIQPEENGNSLIFVTPWKCSACTLCVSLCLKGGIAELHPVAVPRLTELALVRVKPEREGT